MKKYLLSIITVVIFISFSISLFAQDKEKTEEKGYKFDVIKKLPATSVKDQYRSGTCWSFSAVSFLESELLRMGKGEYDLSEMFFVRKDYSEKADLYVRMHGKYEVSAGGEGHDVFFNLKKYGVVPEEVYNGKVIGEKGHVHGEMDDALIGYLEGVVKNSNKKLSPVWKKAYDEIADAYLGEIPEKFSFKGKEYTPITFAKELGINPDDYVEIGSFTHHPFYEKFVIEVPDNWAYGQIYNVPLDELSKIADNSLEEGYTFVWASDVSEKGFSYKNGVAIVPEDDIAILAGLEQAKWADLKESEKDKKLYSFDEPVPEKTITQEMRQLAFDNYSTTDDHGMHIIGSAKDQKGTRYYIVKNSWGTTGNDYEGYFYASEAFFKFKTMYIVVNKNVIPKDIKKKLHID